MERTNVRPQGVAEAPPLLAAFADVEITPSREHVTAAGELKVRSFEVYDPLLARVVVLQQGDVKAAVIGVDAFELGMGVDQKIASHLVGAGIDETGLLLSPSHIGTTTLSNYGSYIAVFAQDLIIDSYEDDCAAKIAGAIREALRKVVPVRISAGATHAPEVVYNRRFIKPDGTVEMLFVRPPEIDPALTEQLTDDELQVVRFDTLDGQQLGALVNFGCHALCSVDRRGNITADYPRYVADVFQCIAAVPAVFTQGGLGDQVPIERTGLACRRIGRSVGAQALYVFEQVRPSESPSLGVYATHVDVPSRIVAEEPDLEARLSLRNSRPRYQRFLWERYHRNPVIKYPIKVVTLQDLAMVNLPGEMFHDTSLAIKGASPFRQTIVISRASREVGYVPTPEAFKQGGMEPELTGIGETSEAIIRKGAIEFLHRIAATQGATDDVTLTGAAPAAQPPVRQ
jgi:hypothetical protein